MVWLLSDLHGRLDFIGWQEFHSAQSQDDVLILLGDICLYDESKVNNQVFTESVLSSRKQILIVDGNHENFDYLNSLPEENWNGGKVHRLSENVLHLQRGYIYDIFGNSCFVFGGTAAMVTDAQLQNAYNNLKVQGHRVDYILTHDYYRKLPQDRKYPFEELLGFIDEKVTFKCWYCGHHHRNQALDENHTVVYDRLVPLFVEKA